MTAGRRVAAIDCGTNSLRLLVSDVDTAGKTDVVRETRIVRLGQGVDATGRLAEEAVDRTLQVVREYGELLSTLGVGPVRFCATSAVRDAENAGFFGDAVESVLGVRPEVLTGSEEAHASFVGATRELPAHRALVVDIGGGSTELVVGEGAEVEWSVSLDVGAVRLTERFLTSDPAAIDQLAACEQHLDGVLAESMPWLRSVESVVGVAGTITNVAAYALGLTSYDRDRLHGSRIRVAGLREASLALARMSTADRRALTFMHPGRADVIGAGALIWDRVLAGVGDEIGEVLISEQDILDGMVWGLAE